MTISGYLMTSPTWMDRKRQVSLLYVTIHLILIMLQNTPNHALLPQQKQGIEKKY